MLAVHLRAAGIEHRREVQLAPPRRFRWDFVIGRLAVEVQGGIWRRSGKGAHQGGTAIKRDLEKGRVAVEAGYIPVAFTTDEVRNGTAITWLERNLPVFV